MSLDLTRIRADFPALAAGAAHFDAPGGTQTPRQVIDAIASALQAPLANRGSRTLAERNAETIVREARAAIADLTNSDPQGVVFGRSATSITFDIARSLARSWGPGDEIVVSRLDHDANIRPWVIAAERSGATVRWAEFDPETGELPVEAVSAVLSGSTRLVAVTAASNLIGTRPDLPRIAAAAHDAGALLYVDGVHYAAHATIDLPALGADFLVCSPYKFLGPHLGALAASPALLETLPHDTLLPATDAVPERFEWGTLPYEMLAGVTAAVNYLADLAPGSGHRRDRLVTAFALLEEQELGLRHRLERGLRDLGSVRIYPRAEHRTSTVLFSVDGHESSAVADHLADAGVNAPAGSFYALEASRHLGLGDTGAIRAGIAPYTSADDVDRLLAALADLR